MSERNGTPSLGTGTAEIPVVRPAATTPESGATPAAPPVPAPDRDAPNVAAEHPEGDLVPGMHPTAPVTVRPTPRMPRRGPLTMMGPWAPVAGGLLGLVLGVVAVLFLASTAESFEDRLALVFVVLGLGMLGTSGILLADEVRMNRQRARDAVVRPAWVEATAGLLNGLTPARLLLLSSAFVLFLSTYVSR
ncbi:hypothetical protein [Blastococcus sp. CT_GayMR16]|uniref:hypothetical protein n=1 Tax=Blastococcus sp. CT_GayMR16 TaxID=2559607 RepID=UPI00107317CC|nr:hypothetical protein [Blastococcus sp. CT_GayMR16]TFV86139.1 hypothetical protein E4P38_17945 [Blastococcus sp. CT_GayMR16]